LADDVILEVMRVASYDAFFKGIQDLKPAVKQTIKPILDACKQKIGVSDDNPFASGDGQRMEVEEEKYPVSAKPAKPSTAAATSRMTTAKPAAPAKPSMGGTMRPSTAVGKNPAAILQKAQAA
jgi:hypothetical protein